MTDPDNIEHMPIDISEFDSIQIKMRAEFPDPDEHDNRILVAYDTGNAYVVHEGDWTQHLDLSDFVRKMNV